MTDFAKEELPVGGQLLLLFGVGGFFLAVGVWLWANAANPEAVNRFRSLSGFSPRGEKETRILSRILGVAFVLVGVGANVGGVMVAFRQA